MSARALVFAGFAALVLTTCDDPPGQDDHLPQLVPYPTATVDPFGLGSSQTELEAWLQERDVETWTNDPGLLVGQTFDSGALIELSGPAHNIRTARLRFGPDLTRQESQTLDALLVKLTQGEFSSLSELAAQVSPELPNETTEFIAYTDSLRVLVERTNLSERTQINVTQR